MIVTAPKTDYNDKMNFLIVTPAVSIDQNFINGNTTTYTAHNAQTTAQTTHKTDFKRTGVQHNLPSSTNSQRWCTVICSAIKCFGNHFGFPTSTASVAINTTFCINNNNNKNNNNNVTQNFLSTKNQVFDSIELNSNCKNDCFQL